MNISLISTCFYSLQIYLNDEPMPESHAVCHSNHRPVYEEYKASI